MVAGRRDGASEAIEGPEIEDLGLEVSQLETFRLLQIISAYLPCALAAIWINLRVRWLISLYLP